MTSSLGASLRQLAMSAVSACNSMTSSESAETLAHIMTSVINAHQETCVYTCDKVALGKFKYDTVMSNKPPVRLCLYTCTLVSVFTVYTLYVCVSIRVRLLVYLQSILCTFVSLYVYAC